MNFKASISLSAILRFKKDKALQALTDSWCMIQVLNAAKDLQVIWLVREGGLEPPQEIPTGS